MRSLLLAIVSFITILTNAQTATTYYNQGLEKFKAKLYNDAYTLFDKAISLDPGLSDAYAYRGVIKADVYNQPIEALADYNKALQLDASSFMAYYLRGQLFQKLDKITEAFNDFARSVQYNPRLEEGWVAMALIKLDAKEYRTAISYYSSAIDVNPRSEKSYYGRAISRHAIKDTSGALQDINKVIELNSRNVPAYIRRAIILSSSDREAAKTDVNKALEIDPNNQFAKKIKGALLDMEKAENDLANLKRAKDLTTTTTIQKGMDFLAVNGKKLTVFSTPSGLQYEILRQGFGSLPSSTDVVVANCTGKLLDGKVLFDLKNTEFNLQSVIKGFAEGLQLIPVGATYRLYIPYYLGYGLQGTAQVPGGSLTIYDVELLSIKK